MKQACEVCKVGEVLVPQIELAEYLWTECDNCGAIHMWYDPQDYQVQFHLDTHRIKGLFGGYGSGKTTMAVAEIIDHALSTPNGQALLLTKTMKQLEETVKKEFFRQCPEPIIKEYKVKDQKVVLTNGFTFLFYTSDDPIKIRSLNLTSFYIEEASGVSYEIYDVCKTRLRSPFGLRYKRTKFGEIENDINGDPIIESTHYLGIVCSNPDVNWIRGDFLLQSSEIYCTSDQEYFVEHPDQFLSSHIIRTDQNKYLPPDFITMLKSNKPDW